MQLTQFCHKIGAYWIFESRKHTVLLVGAFNSKIVSAQKLLELGANPNIRSKHDSNPFLTVCFYAIQIDSARKLMQLMISHGADVNAVQIDTSLDQFGKPLHFRASALEIGVTYGTLEVVQTLLENGATVSGYPNNEGSIVARAVLAGNIDIIKSLIVEKHAPLPDYCVVRQQGLPHEKK